MIYFLVQRHAKETIYNYLGLAEPEMIWHVQPVFYDQLDKYVSRIKNGVVIFSDIERLNDNERALYQSVYDELATREGVRILNHPTKSMRRYELLETMHTQGINRFRAFRINDDLESLRFPVFVRGENDHAGNHSGLIANHDELNARLDSYPDKNGLLITEFCDVKSGAQKFRKYSTFCLDGQIVARHLLFSEHWVTKRAGTHIMDQDDLKEELDYVKQNPHESEVAAIFKLARIDYGRIDYGIVDGQIQVWEINTNPNILVSSMLKKGTPRLPVQLIFKGVFRNELILLAGGKDQMMSVINYVRNLFAIYLDISKQVIRGRIGSLRK